MASDLLLGISAAATAVATLMLVIVTRELVKVTKISVDVQRQVGLLHKTQAAMQHSVKIQEIRTWLMKTRREVSPGVPRRAIDKLDALLEKSTRRTTDSLVADLDIGDRDEAEEQLRIIEAHAKSIRRFIKR